MSTVHAPSKTGEGKHAGILRLGSAISVAKGVCLQAAHGFLSETIKYDFNGTHSKKMKPKWCFLPIAMCSYYMHGT